MKILYIENNQHFYEAVKKEFLSDHDLFNETSADKAISLYDSQEFDLVLVDYDLDDSKGLEVVDHIRDRDKSIPIIAVSSHDLGNRRMLSAGATAQCGKMKFKNINAIIARVTSRRK